MGLLNHQSIFIICSICTRRPTNTFRLINSVSGTHVSERRNICYSFVKLNKKLPSHWGAKKKPIYRILHVKKVMSEMDPKIAEILNPLRELVKAQGLSPQILSSKV